MPDSCPPMGKALEPVALRFFPLLGMYQGINHPMAGSIVKLLVTPTSNEGDDDQHDEDDVLAEVVYKHV